MFNYLALWFLDHTLPACLGLFFLVGQVRFSSAAYIPRSPYRYENYNPAEADPAGAIKCVGDRYDGELPVDEYFNPNTASMQKLCAKPQYGGGSPGTHIGGWCSWKTIRTPGQRTVTVWTKRFDLSYDAHVHPALAIPRVMLACYYRCYCPYPFDDPPSSQPRADEVIQGNQILNDPALSARLPPYTYQIKVDVVDDFDVPVNQHVGAGLTHMVPSLPVYALNQIDFTLRDFARQDTSPEAVGPPHNPWISMLPQNSITCRGNLPEFPLPLPYQLSDFQNLQQLCAVAHFGGHTGANAGGYCHRSQGASPNQEAHTVWFSDEFTPRLEWTWTPNWLAAGAIRFHCWQRCACSSAPTRDNVTIGMWMSPIAHIWRVAAEHQLAQQSDGSITYEQVGSGNGKPGTSLGQVLPRQRGATPSAGSCGHDHKQFCPERWPVDVLGPVPRAPADATQVWKAPGEEGKNLTQCGARCQGPKDCGSGDGSGEDGCFCALPSPQDSRRLGLDPVAPVAVCLALVHMALSGGIAGREVEKFVDERGEQYRCLCNETYVSPECCGSGRARLDSS